MRMPIDSMLTEKLATASYVHALDGSIRKPMQHIFPVDTAE